MPTNINLVVCSIGSKYYTAGDVYAEISAGPKNAYSAVLQMLPWIVKSIGDTYAYAKSVGDTDMTINNVVSKNTKISLIRNLMV